MNILKPKKTTFNAKALVYRRVNKIGYSLSSECLYQCQNATTTLNFMFDKIKQEFVSVEQIQPTYNNEFNADRYKTIVVNQDGNKVFTSKDENGKPYYFRWSYNADNGKGRWVKTETLPQTYTSLANAGYSNVGKYQMNKYVFVGSLDYVIKGEVAGTKTQAIKGLVMPLTTMNIQYFDDALQLDEEDLVVIDGTLFSVESPDYTIKHLPRPYKIYYATLNSIM